MSTFSKISIFECSIFECYFHFFVSSGSNLQLFEDSDDPDNTWKASGEYCMESRSTTSTEQEDADYMDEEEEDTMFYRSCTCLNGSRLASPACAPLDRELTDFMRSDECYEI